MPSRSARRRAAAAAVASATLAVALLTTAAPAAATPSCSAVLFLPVDGSGAYMVEQPQSAAGAIFCEPSLAELEFAVAEAPAHGSLSALEPNGLGGASFTYAPAPGFAGADSFTFSASDGEGDPVVMALDVSVRPAGDDAPVCSAQLAADHDGERYRVEGGAPVAGSIECFDDEGAELSFAVQTGPGHGTLSEIEPEGSASASFTYTPSPGYEGDDAFALVADDGTQDSAPAPVELSVGAPVDDPPQCTATMVTTSDASGAFEVEADETVDGAVTCVDEQSAALDFTLAVPPSNGALAPLEPSGDGGLDIAYTPAPGYVGFDSFGIDVADGTNPAVRVTVRVRAVAARNDPPTCTAHLLAPVAAGAYRVKQGATVSGEVDCEDDEGAALEYAIATPPQHGSVTPVDEDGRFSYTAPVSYLGADELALVADDGEHESEPAVLGMTVVAAVNEPPACEVALEVGAAADGAYLVERDSEVRGRIVCSDDASAELDLEVASPPLHGSLSELEPDGPASAAFTYTPTPGYLGPDTFALLGDDGETDPQATTIVVQVVEPSPDAPHCRARLHTASSLAGYEVESGETVAGTLTCFGAGEDELSFSVARPPEHGEIAGLEPAAADVARFAYTADGAWTGPDDFALVAGDGQHSSDPVEVEVSVVPQVDDPPECAISLFSEKLPSGAYAAEEGEANPGAVVCVDDEGQPLTFSVAEAPEHGAVSGLEPEGESAMFEYLADAGHFGADAVSVSVRDPGDGEDVVGLELEVGPAANTAPLCTATLDAPHSAGAYTVEAGRPTTGEVSCEDGELDLLAFSVAQAPGHGALSPLTGSGERRSFTYTAAAAHRGPDQFALKANDGRVDSALVAIAVSVEGPDLTIPGDDGSGGGGESPGPTPPPAPPAAEPKPTEPKPTEPKRVACAQRKGKARTVCMLDERLARSCGKLRGKAKAACEKRIRARAKCDAIKARGKRGRALKKACRRKAQAKGRR